MTVNQLYPTDTALTQLAALRQRIVNVLLLRATPSTPSISGGLVDTLATQAQDAILAVVCGLHTDPYAVTEQRIAKATSIVESLELAALRTGPTPMAPPSATAGPFGEMSPSILAALAGVAFSISTNVVRSRARRRAERDDMMRPRIASLVVLRTDPDSLTLDLTVSLRNGRTTVLSTQVPIPAVEDGTEIRFLLGEPALFDADDDFDGDDGGGGGIPRPDVAQSEYSPPATPPAEPIAPPEPLGTTPPVAKEN